MKITAANLNAHTSVESKKSYMVVWKKIWKFRWHYFMLLPGVVVVFLFSYLPLAGIQIAFRDYNIFAGLWKSPWVGLEHFSFITDKDFWKVFENTIWITALKFIFGFPAPILLAIMLNEVRNQRFKRIIQSLTYMPHFVSWIIVAYIIEILLAESNGLVNNILASLGLDRVYFMGKEDWFRPLIVVSSIWKEVGWGSIIFLAAIAGIDPQLYDAAKVDGASKWRQMWNVTLPCMLPTISIMLILTIPNLLNAGFDQIYPLQNPVNMPVSEVVDTYVVRTGLNLGYYGPAAAIGLSTGIIQLLLVIGANSLSRRFGGSRLF